MTPADAAAPAATRYLADIGAFALTRARRRDRQPRDRVLLWDHYLIPLYAIYQRRTLIGTVRTPA